MEEGTGTGALRLIFVNRYFHPDHSATSQILSDLAFSLAARGAAVRVITSRQRYDDARARLPRRECVGGVEIHRVWTARFDRHNLALRLLDYISFYVTATWKLWRLTRRGDTVIAKTDPPLFPVIAAAVIFLRRARLANWLQDVFPETAEALGIGGWAGSLAFRPLRPLRNISLRAAAVNVAIGERMASWLHDKGIAAGRIAVIHNWADGAAIRPVPAEENPLRRAWGLEGRFVVGYSGNFGRAHELDTLLDAMTLVAKQGAEGAPDTVFLFIGGGALFAAMRPEAQTRGLANVMTQPYQPAEWLAQSLSVADVHLISLRPELESFIVPSKLYGVLAAGRPALFIGDEGGEVARILREARCGYSVPQGDGATLAARIAGLARDSAGRAAMGRNARTHFDRRYEREIAVSAWAALLAGLEERKK